MLSYLNLTYRTMIKITNKIIKSADDYPLPYLQFEPENNTRNKSIILVYEIFGLTDHIKNVAKEYAENGFLVVIPDIFSRLENNIDLPYNKNGFSKGLYLKEKLGWELPVMDIVASPKEEPLLSKMFKVPVTLAPVCVTLNLSAVDEPSYVLTKTVLEIPSVPSILSSALTLPFEF